MKLPSRLSSLLPLALVTSISTALLQAAPAHAGLVYSNGAPDFSGALVSDAVLPTQSALGTGQQGAELFRTPATPADPSWNFHVIQGLRFWGSYLGGPVPQLDDFTFTLSFAHNIDQLSYIRHFAPGEVQRSAAPVGWWTKNDALGNSTQVAVYEYLAPLSFAMALDSESWISVFNHTANDAADWAWAFSGSGDDSSLWRNHPGWWTTRQSDFAFELLGPGAGPAPVSEPAGLLLAGLAALAVAGRRSRGTDAQIQGTYHC